MNALFLAAADLQAFCSAHGWNCCVIGGLAVQRWGEPRQAGGSIASMPAELRHCWT